MKQTRPLSAIARDIAADWPNPNYAAVPYLREMLQMDDVNTLIPPGYCEDGRTMILYFLSNARSWRGTTAKAIKAELRGLLS